MPNPGDFDPAEAIRQQRAAEEAEKQREEAEKQREEVEKQRLQALSDLHRAKQLKLLRYADEQLKDVSNPIVSEFVVTERGRKERFFGGTRQHQRQTRYYGSWLLLSNNSGYLAGRRGLVKLRRPHAGYAYLEVIDDWDPRNVGYVTLNLDAWNPRSLGSVRLHITEYDLYSPPRFRIFASLEEVTEDTRLGEIETLTKYVTRALDFVANGQPPEPESTSYPSTQW